MYCTRKITEDISYIGSSDRRLSLFENMYPVPNGVSYNAYFLDDEKIAILDTVDKSIMEQYLENIDFLLNGRTPDYIIVNHMEPDHCAALGTLCAKYPSLQIVCTAKATALIGQFYNAELAARCLQVKEGDTLSLGRHTLAFYTAPMVHWPEVMVTYDQNEHVLFSADAFGTFGALGGSIFADETGFDFAEARRYYANIVGKYGPQVLALLKKAAGLAIDCICPLHGPIWRRDFDAFVEKYQKWASYTPEEKAVLIAYGSIYGGTQNAAEILAAKLADKGVTNLAVYDVSCIHPSYLVSEAFRCSHLVFASSTYNNGIFTNMETLLLDLKAHALKNRTAALMENGSWAPQSGKLMRELLSSMPGITLLEETVSLRSTVKPDNLTEIDALASALAADLQ